MVLRPAMLVCAACAAGISFAQTYRGAEAALKAMQDQPASVKPEIEPTEQLWQAARTYARTAPHLSPEQAARRWLALADRCPQSSAIWELNNSGENAFSIVIRALPRPSVWPELKRLIQDRLSKSPGTARDWAMLAMVETLLGERGSSWDHLSRIEGGLSLEQQCLLEKVRVKLALRSGDQDRIEGAYRSQALAMSKPTQPIGGDKAIELPDLPTLLGPERALKLLKQLLLSFDGELVIERPGAFRKSAIQTALAEVANLKHPQWTLAIDADGGPLFEALAKRFPESSRGIRVRRGFASDSFAAAASNYMVYLVANGRAAEATAFAKRQDSPYWLVIPWDLALLEEHGKTDEYLHFLEGLISTGYDSLLDSYTSFCLKAGQRERAREFAATLPASKRGDRGGATYREVSDLVANDKLVEAAELLRAELQSAGVAKSMNSNPNLASAIADIGLALGRQEYVDIGIAAVEQTLGATSGSFINGWVYLVLMESGRGVEAERLLALALQKAAHENSIPPGGHEELGYLVRVYAGSGRYADVVTLLEEAPNWGASDLAFTWGGAREDSVSFLAAKALTEVGRKSEAMQLLLFVLQTEPDLDQAYELLLKLDPDRAGPILDAMHRVSPMASRPLMWKAKLLQLQGRVFEAEKLVRQAIALDPQDTGAVWNSNTRFQAWTILASIERQQGEQDLARMHQLRFDSHREHSPVRRQGWYSLDLHGRKNRLKELADNPDDFMLGFRVAYDLKEAGRLEEGRAQYLLALRTMAGQIGRAGNASVDRVPEYADDADKLAEDLVRSNPNDLGAHLVRAELRAAAGDANGARDDYLRAIAIDRDCLVAWSGLEQIESLAGLAPGLKEEVCMNLVRLAPLTRWRMGGSIRNLSALWNTADKALQGALSVDEPIFQLRSSRSESEPFNNFGKEWRWPPSPGSIVGREPAIASFAHLISSLAKDAKAGGEAP